MIPIKRKKIIFMTLFLFVIVSLFTIKIYYNNDHFSYVENNITNEYEYLKNLKKENKNEINYFFFDKEGIMFNVAFNKKTKEYNNNYVETKIKEILMDQAIERVFETDFDLDIKYKDGMKLNKDIASESDIKFFNYFVDEIKIDFKLEEAELLSEMNSKELKEQEEFYLNKIVTLTTLLENITDNYDVSLTMSYNEKDYEIIKSKNGEIINNSLKKEYFKK